MDWCWSWNSNTLATSCEELTHWKRPWYWEGSGAGGEGDNRGWDGWMASPTQWTRVWVNSGSWWWTGRPGVLWFMGSQRVGHDWATELNWTECIIENCSEIRKSGRKEEYNLEKQWSLRGWHYLGEVTSGQSESYRLRNNFSRTLVFVRLIETVQTVKGLLYNIIHLQMLCTCLQ